MKRSLRAVSAVCAAIAIAAAYACGSDSASDPPQGADAQSSVDAATGTDPTTDRDSATGSDGATGDGSTAEDSGSDGAIPNFDSLVGLKIALLGSAGSSTALKDFFLAQTGQATETINPATLGAADLAPFDVLIVANLPRSYMSAEADALAAWVSSGKGVYFLPGFTGVNTNHNSLLTRFQMQLDGFLGGSGTDHDLLTFAPHPVTKNVKGLLFFGGASVGGADGGDAAAYPSYATLGADVVGRAGSFGAGRIVVFGDEWICYDGEVNYTIDAGPLPADGGANESTPTKQYWHNAIAWVAGRL